MDIITAGAGVIRIDTVDIVDMDSTFPGNPPEFSLRAATGGGPPVEYYWTRNGEPISDDDTYDIALDVANTRPGSTPLSDTLQNARYNSTLVVRGNLPGVYQYTVGNRATSTMVTSGFNIEGILVMHDVPHIPLVILLSFREPGQSREVWVHIDNAY